MRFLADMGISLRTVEWLRSQGYDIVHLRDEGLQRLPDPEILEKARLENRILLTIDLDFAQLLATLQSSLPSVILFRLGNENYDQINDCLSILLTDCMNDLLLGAIISVNNRGFRVRKLPIN
jgi:predicted nuclease of predicted toxin-antitoxin system